ncbi:MAG TPA: efflux RND transporter permease subunit [Dongiaceae bacterium]|nr:efflux RND transporter permease subunit [Dongiaceae bacterium]
MHRFVEALMRNSRVVLAGFLLLLIFGAVAFKTMPLEANPSFPLPYIYAQVVLPGISPEDAERLIAKPMERKLQNLEGLDELRSISYLGGASVAMKFDAGFNPEKALNDVREKVDLAKAELPSDAKEPTIHEISTSLLPVLVVTLSGNVPDESLIRLARNLKDRIETLHAVLEARLTGDREDVVIAEIDPLRLQSYGLDADAVGALVARSNRLVPAGTLDNGTSRFAVKVPGLFQSPADILDLPIRVNGDAVVRLKDIATLKATFRDPQTLAHINGLPAIGIEISKRAGENIIDTVAAVQALVAEEQKSWPAQIRATYSGDASSSIRDLLGDLGNNLVSAILLVMIVVIGSLGVRSGLIVGLSVPGSFLIGILCLSLVGVTINVVVLFSLIMATGMLVDGAIVLVEYADRKMLEGDDRRRAYTKAAQRMAWPIFSSTATILAAFLPLLFWPGIVGQYMRYLPITLLAVLGASLAMALVFVPAIGALFGKPGAEARTLLENERLPLAQQLAAVGGLERYYLRALRFCLARPGTTVLTGLGILVAVYITYGQFGAGVEFFPKIEPQRALVNIHARGNIAMSERARLIGEAENRILAIERDRHEFASIYSVAQADVQQIGSSQTSEDTIGTITLEFGPWNTRRPAAVILEDVRQRLAELPGLRIEAQEEKGGPGPQKPIDLQLSGTDTQKLREAAEILRRHFDSMPGLTSIDDTLPAPGIEWQVKIDRGEAAKYGIDVTALGNVVRLLTDGVKFGSYRPDYANSEVDIVARYPDPYRQITGIDELRITTADGSVPASSFITRQPVPKVGLINRVNGMQVYSVRADLKPSVLADSQVQALKAWLPHAPIDSSIRVSFQGEDKEQQKSAAFLARAFGVALALIGAILLLHFNSFFYVGLIMSACIMSTIGVMAGLLITHQPFGIVMTGIGIISLAGIVVSNNIILIDTYVQSRSQHSSALDALLISGVQRFRPVFLTTSTTVLGLLPLVFQTNVDFLTRTVSVGAPSTQWWVQLATAVVFGLLFAKALTLLFTPCALLLAAKLRDSRLIVRLLGRSAWSKRVSHRAAE